MKGIILAGGKGTRLDPLTKVVSKQLLPVYDKPMIMYPLGTLRALGITEILIICTRESLSGFYQLLGDGEEWGLVIQYEIQDEPNGIAEAFIIGEEFIGDDSVTLMLGDNIIVSPLGVGVGVELVAEEVAACAFFGYPVLDPTRYGVIEVERIPNGHSPIGKIVEKPSADYIADKDVYAVIGLYVFDNTVVRRAKECKPSKRGELEIADIINSYLEDEEDRYSRFQMLDRTAGWFDCGTFNDLLDCANYIRSLKSRSRDDIGL